MWDESFEPIVKSLWEQYHEEKCAWAIIRHFPLSYVSKHEKDLAIRKNRPFVIRRLCEDKSYAVDRDKLTPYEYIWVLSTTGRDITTEVFPDADFKFYLDASVDERAKRRYLQNKEKGIECTLEEIKQAIEERDYDDMNRPVGALTRTDDQIYIDSSNMSIDEVVNKMLGVINK